MDQDLPSLLRTAWRTIRPRLDDDSHDLAKRIARRRNPSHTRPPRAWCIALRASDHRLPTPHSSLSTHHFPTHLTTSLIQHLTSPLHLEHVRLTAQELAEKLGTTPVGLTMARLRDRFTTDYIKGLGNRHGHPVPLLAPRDTLDPQSKTFAPPDPVWDITTENLAAHLPDDFEQTLQRIPIYHRRGPAYADTDSLHPEHPLVDTQPPRSLSRKLPPPRPDYVWYKWMKGQEIYLGDDPQWWRKSPDDPGIPPGDPRRAESDHAREAKRAHQKQLRKHHHRPVYSRGSLMFRGWAWLCPLCGKPVRKIYLPMPPINLLKDDLPMLAKVVDIRGPNDGRFAHRPFALRKEFACAKCHGVRQFSRAPASFWNDTIAYLTAGLLYGREVPRPAWAKRQRKTAYKPRPNRAPSQRRPQIIELLLAGLTPTEIAKKLHITPLTAIQHLKLIYAQHGVTGPGARERLAKKLGRPMPTAWITKREQVRAHLAAGLSIDAIAQTMRITEKAVRHHIALLRTSGITICRLKAAVG
jgi:DNA-binding NarL/FixJ family response regulator